MAQPLILEPKLEVGARVDVHEQSHSELTQHWKSRAAAVGAVESIEVERRYSQEVKSARPERLWRSYEVSTRVKFREGPGETREPQRTSLHGRAVHVNGLAFEPDGPFEISKEDREALRLDRLLAACLPSEGVSRGDSWTVDSEKIGRALFGPYVPLGNMEGSGAKVELRSVREKKGRQVAVLRVRRLAIKMAGQEKLPTIDMQLHGEIQWAVEAGVPLFAQLEGPVEYGFRVNEGAQRGHFTASGPFQWSYRAEILEARLAPTQADREGGAAPPPGARVLLCERNAGHRYELKNILHCPRCGALLEERACAEHGFILQHCPQDGAPLRPQ